MQRKILFILLAVQLCGIFTSLGYAEINARVAEPQKAEELVAYFYQWYVTVYGKDKIHPAERDAIYEYVAACTIERCRRDLRKGSVDADYFLKTNDFSPEDADKLIVYKGINLNECLSLVPVGGAEPYLLVFVQKEQGELRIVKVEDIFPR